MNKDIRITLDKIQYLKKDNVGGQFQLNFSLGQLNAGFNFLALKNGKTTSVNKILFEQTVKAPSTLKLAVSGNEIDKINDPLTPRCFILQIKDDSPQNISFDFGTTVTAKGGDKPRIGNLVFFFIVEIFNTPDIIGDDGIEIPPLTFPPFFFERLNNAKYPPLIAVSDVHMGKDAGVDDFDINDDVAFTEMLKWANSLGIDGKPSGPQRELILLGDILEIWESLPQLSITGKGNIAVAGAARVNHLTTRETELGSIINKIASKNVTRKAAFLAQKIFSKKAGNKVVYIPGNHDGEMTNPASQKVYEQQAGKTQFVDGKYKNKVYDLEVRHGHEFDPNNFTTDVFADKPLGRYITEILVRSAETFIASNGQKDLFDNVDALPTTSFKDYFNCLINSNAINPGDVRRLNRLARNLFSTTPSEKLPVGRTQLMLLRNFPNLVTIEKLMDKASSKENNTGNPNIGDAKGAIGKCSCIMMGHNHQEELTAIGADKLYVNTGTWADKESFIPQNPNNQCTTTRINTRHVAVFQRVDTINENGNDNPNGGNGKTGDPVVFVYLFQFIGKTPTLINSSNYKIT